MNKALPFLCAVCLTMTGQPVQSEVNPVDTETMSSHLTTPLKTTGVSRKITSEDTAFAVDIHGNTVNGVLQPWNTYDHRITDLSDRTLVGQHFEENLRPWALAWSANKSTLYGISRELEQTKLLRFDPATGESETIGILSGYGDDVAITGIAIDQTNTCYVIGIDRGNHDTIASLYRCNLISAQLTLIGTQSTAPDLHDIVATCDGSLYGVDSFQHALYKLDKTNGEAELVGAMGFQSDVGLFNVTYDRKNDAIIQYVTAESQSYFTALAVIDPESGEATFLNSEYTFGTYVGASESSCDEQVAAFDINTAFNGSWFNPMTDGQGFVFDVLPVSDTFYAAWFTFAEAATNSQIPGDENHRWMTAQGPLGTGNAVTLSLLNTTGGVFNQAAQVENAVVGTLEITFENCSEGTVSFSFTESGLSDSFTIQRIAGDQVEYCESLIAAGLR